MILQLFWNIFVLMVLVVYDNVRCTSENIFVTLQLDTEVIRIGDDMVLTCVIHGVDIIDTELIRQWSKGTDLICHNGKLNDPAKYREMPPKGNKIGFVVRNVTESDFNCNYQCSYGFHVDTKKIELTNSRFEYRPSSNEKQILYTHSEDGNMTLSLHFKKIFPMPHCKAEIQGEMREFVIVKNLTNGTYHDVRLVLVSNKVHVLKCKETITVVCKLVTEYSFNTSDENRMCDAIESIIFASCVSIMVVIIAVIFVCRKWLKHQGTAKDDHEEVDLQEPCLTGIVEDTRKHDGGVTYGHSHADQIKSVELKTVGNQQSQEKILPCEKIVTMSTDINETNYLSSAC